MHLHGGSAKYVIFFRSILERGVGNYGAVNAGEGKVDGG